MDLIFLFSESVSAFVRKHVKKYKISIIITAAFAANVRSYSSNSMVKYGFVMFFLQVSIRIVWCKTTHNRHGENSQTFWYHILSFSICDSITVAIKKIMLVFMHETFNNHFLRIVMKFFKAVNWSHPKYSGQSWYFPDGMWVEYRRI